MKPIPSPARPALLIACLLTAMTHIRAHDVSGEMVAAANNFLAALTPEQRAKAVFEMKHEERQNWDFVPRARSGLPIKEMTQAQRLLGQALLNSGLSQRGYAKATTIMSLEQILFDLENQRPIRDPELYFVTIFGTPSTTEPWGWRFEGHHLSVNFTVAGHQVQAHSPSFFGSNPAEVRQSPRQGLRVLAQEEDLGYRLARSLTDEQKRTAIFNETAPRDIVTGKRHKVSTLSPEGLPAARMNPDQRQTLEELVREFAHRFRVELADDDLKKIEAAGWDKVCFAWAGGLEPGQGHYFRVQGPTFLIEFDNTQGNANHIHSVWRDFANDFGEDLLRKHYEQAPHAH